MNKYIQPPWSTLLQLTKRLFNDENACLSIKIESYAEKKTFFHQKTHFFQHLFAKLHTQDYRVSQVVKETSMLPSEIDQMEASQ